MPIIRNVYYGVPRLFGACFRATKLPIICFLVLWLGGAFSATAYLMTYAVKYHSTLPLDLFKAGLLEIAQEGTPPPPLKPADARLLETMTLHQKQSGKTIAYGFMVYIFVLVGIAFWWIVAFFKFLAKLAKTPPSPQNG